MNVAVRLVGVLVNLVLGRDPFCRPWLWLWLWHTYLLFARATGARGLHWQGRLLGEPGLFSRPGLLGGPGVP
ncbi:MAG: hypothetical protein ACYCUF_06270 [Acidimicrobiales bacterium]